MKILQICLFLPNIVFTFDIQWSHGDSNQKLSGKSLTFFSFVEKWGALAVFLQKDIEPMQSAKDLYTV